MVFGSEMLLLAIMETIEGSYSHMLKSFGFTQWASCLGSGRNHTFSRDFYPRRLICFHQKFFKLFWFSRFLSDRLFSLGKGIIQNLIDNFTGSIIYQLQCQLLRNVNQRV